MDQTLLHQAQQLPTEDRLELIDALWQSRAPGDLPVSAADRALLAERLRDLEHHPEAERSWDQVRTDLYTRLA